MASQGEVAAALCIAGEVAIYNEVMAANGDSANDSFLMNVDAAACLHGAVPGFFDVAVLEGNESAAVATLG